MKAILIQLTKDHLELIISSFFHFCFIIFYAYLEYRKGLDKMPENSYMAVLLNKIKGVKE